MRFQQNTFCRTSINPDFEISTKRVLRKSINLDFGISTNHVFSKYINTDFETSIKQDVQKPYKSKFWDFNKTSVPETIDPDFEISTTQVFGSKTSIHPNVESYTKQVFRTSINPDFGGFDKIRFQEIYKSRF